MFHYDPLAHQIEILVFGKGSKDLDELKRVTAEILPGSCGTAIVFLANIDRVAGVYDNPLTLVWRDAGALLQTMFLAATAFRLAFCPLGILGHQVARALGLERRLTAVGVMLIGRPVEHA